MGGLSQLTVRGFDPELERRLRRLAREQGVSLNRAALLLLRRGAGIREAKDDDPTIGNALDRFFGVCSESEGEDLLKSIEDMERVDESFWS